MKILRSKKSKIFDLKNFEIFHSKLYGNEKFRDRKNRNFSISKIFRCQLLTFFFQIEFFIKLFDTQTKRGIITLNDGTLVLYNILEQKMLDNSSTSKSDAIMKIKSAMFNEGLIKTLRNKYQTEIFIQGL